MSKCTYHSGNNLFVSIIILLSVAATTAKAQVEADGLLDQEALYLLEGTDLDGDGVRDLLDGRRAAGFFWIDNVDDGAFPVGPDGFRDAGLREPDLPTEETCDVCLDPDYFIPSVRSSVNTGRLTIIYLPDTDGIIRTCDAASSNAGAPCMEVSDCPGGSCMSDADQDDSALYVGMDIFNGDARRVPAGATGVPDVDYHDIDFLDTLPEGDICEDGVQHVDGDGEVDVFGLPFDVDADGDPSGIRWVALPECDADLLLSDDNRESYEFLLYACAETVGNAARLSGLFVGSVGLVVNTQQTQIELETYFPSLPEPVTEAWLETFPDPRDPDSDETTDLPLLGPRDVEFIIRHVDTIVDRSFPATSFAVDRYRLAMGGVQSFSDANGDSAAEDRITAPWFLPVPELEVTKKVRCEGEGDDAWRDTAEVLPGTTLEFKMEVENTGNVDLAVCFEDLLEDIGAANVAIDFTSPITATLYRPADNAVGIPYNDVRVCSDDSDNPGDPCQDNQDCANGVCEPAANPFFFLPGAGGFLGAIAQGAGCGDPRTYLGPLRGSDACGDPDSPMLGDKVVLTFKTAVTALGDSCDEPLPVDVRNAVTTIGDPDIPAGAQLDPPNGNEAEDIAGVIDTPRERVQGFDDNVVSADVLCRDVEFTKWVGFPGNEGSFVTGDVALGIPRGPFPIQIEYRYTVENNGEVDEEFVIRDYSFCEAVRLDGGDLAGVSFVDCNICTVPPEGEFTVTVAPGGESTAVCVLEFADAAAVDAFVALDDTDPECSATKPECFENCADTTASGVNLGPICGLAPGIPADSYATVCTRTCDISVDKQVRCLPACNPNDLPSEEGWVGIGYYLDNPEALGVTPGACVQYRIIVTNESEEVSTCALKFADLMENAPSFGEGPTNCRVEPPGVCDELCPFDWTGGDTTCPAVLAPGTSLTVFFAAKVADPGVADPNADPVNHITVMCAAEGDCPAAGPQYSDTDSDDVPLDIQACSFTVTKDVTCDDPGEPTAVWADQVDALPGATVGFRIQVCNDGDVDLPRIIIEDDLGCPSWFVPFSVVATINGDDVTGCICPPGGCDDIGDLSGSKDLKPCRAGGIRATNPDECLTIIFEATVPSDAGPDVECRNDVSINVSNDVCGPDSACGGPQSADATVVVEVPGIRCTKEVCADLNNDGDCDDPGDFPYTEDLALPCDTPFPFWLIHRATVTNDGETTLLNVEACDPPYGCKPCGTGTLLPGGSCEVTWTIPVADRPAWEALAGSDTDGNKNCYSDTVTTTGDVDTATICARGADTDVDSICSARVCLAPPCDISVTKGVRCLDNCDDQTPDGQLVDSLTAIPGATVEFEIRVTNEDAEVPICALRFGDSLTGPFTRCEPADTFCQVQLINGAGDPTCSVPPGWFTLDGSQFDLDIFDACGTLMQPGDEVVIRCAGTVADNSAGETITNEVEVTCAPDDGENCADGPIFCGEPESADAEVQIGECGLTVTKQVRCEGENDAAWRDAAEALPGSNVEFRILVCNDGDVPIDRVEIDDQLSCNWPVSFDPVAATIDGVDVTDCICTDGTCNSIAEINGLKDLSTCPPGAIPPGECLTIQYTVAVPPDFDETGTAVDCTNTVDVGGFTGVCAPSGPCDSEAGSATVNVLVPDIECTKEVCIDLNNDGDCIDSGEYPYTDDLSLPCDMPFPFWLNHEVTVTNTGEAPLLDVEVCDPPYGCQTCGQILSSPCRRTWTIPVPDRGAWEVLAGGNHCLENTATVTGTVDTAAICDAGADTDVETSCSAQACLPPPCAISVSKGFRCVDNCGARNPLGVLTDSLVAIPGATVEFEIRVTNVDPDVPICALRFTDELIGPFERCPQVPPGPSFCRVQLINGAGNPMCSVAGDWFKTDGTPFELNLYQACGANMGDGDELVIRCAGSIPANPVGDTTTNEVDITCAPDDEENCADGAIFCGVPVNDSADVQIGECSLTVTKEVRCEGEDDAAWRNSAETLPGSDVEFRVQVCNDGNVPIDRVRISDQLSCNWAVSFDPVAATVDGADVTDCVCTDGTCNTIGEINGLKDLSACPPGAIVPGECLTIIFKVTVPDNFSQMGTPTDCTNTIGVNGYVDVCSPSEPCDTGLDNAIVNVLVPDLDCEKTVCVDFGGDGCDTPYLTDINYQEFQVSFPLVLHFRLRAANSGETPLDQVEICDDDCGGCQPCPTPLAPGQTCDVTCTRSFVNMEAWATAANINCDENTSNNEGILNTARTSAVPVIDGGICGEAQRLPERACSARVCIGEEPCVRPPCPPVTKAHVDIWNQNEDGFSGTTRCISSWDQTLLSEYTDGAANNFWWTVLHTDKGKARINGMASTVCEGSVDAPLLGVVAKVLHFIDGSIATAGTSLIGQGYETGQIRYDVVEPPDPLLRDVKRKSRPPDRSGSGGHDAPDANVGPVGADDPAQDVAPANRNDRGATTLSRAAVDQKGSLLVWAKVEIKWNEAGDVIQDTFVSLLNDYPADVSVQLYLVDDDLCVWADNLITLTGNEPTYWSVFNGQPKGVTPMTTFRPDGCPDDDPFNRGGRRLEGYLLAWAVDPITREEISWNHLSGMAQIVNYQETSAWEYNAWAFQAVAGVNVGDSLLPPAGQLDLDGVEYSSVPGALLLDFFASGAVLPANISLDTDLTLWVANKDLRQDSD